MRVTSKQGDWSYVSSTPEQMVGYLWKTAFIEQTSPGEYMKEVARRVAVLDCAPVRTDTAANFLTDLEKSGVVTINWNEGT